MTFSKALKLLKKHHRMRRSIWYPNEYIEYDERKIYSNYVIQANIRFIIVESCVKIVKPYNPTINDLLENDWIIYDVRN